MLVYVCVVVWGWNCYQRCRPSMPPPTTWSGCPCSRRICCGAIRPSTSTLLLRPRSTTTSRWTSRHIYLPLSVSHSVCSFCQVNLLIHPDQVYLYYARIAAFLSKLSFVLSSTYVVLQEGTRGYGHARTSSRSSGGQSTSLTCLPLTSICSRWTVRKSLLLKFRTFLFVVVECLVHMISKAVTLV